MYLILYVKLIAMCGDDEVGVYQVIERSRQQATSRSHLSLVLFSSTAEESIHSRNVQFD